MITCPACAKEQEAPNDVEKDSRIRRGAPDNMDVILAFTCSCGEHLEVWESDGKVLR